MKTWRNASLPVDPKPRMQSTIWISPIKWDWSKALYQECLPVPKRLFHFSSLQAQVFALRKITQSRNLLYVHPSVLEHPPVWGAHGTYQALRNLQLHAPWGARVPVRVGEREREIWKAAGCNVKTTNIFWERWNVFPCQCSHMLQEASRRAIFSTGCQDTKPICTSPEMLIFF